MSKLTEKQKSVLAVANRNISEYPKYKTKNALGMMIHLFQDLTKYGIPIPEELQSIISEAFDKGWLKNNAPKPKGAKEQSVKMFMLCGKLYDQMCDRELSMKHGLTTKNKHVEYFAKKINRTPTAVLKMIEKYGDSFANVECDYFGYFKKKKPTTRKMKILEEWFISKKDRTWKVQLELMKNNPNSIKNRRKT